MAKNMNQSSHPINMYGAPAKQGKGLGASGKEQFKTTGGNPKGPTYGNAGGRKNQQPKGKGEQVKMVGTPDDSKSAKEGLWKHENSMGQDPNC